MPETLDNPEVPVPEELQGQVKITTLDRIYNWGRRSSVWPMMFGLACCGIEMIAAAASRYDLARFGMEIMRPSPRQTDLIIVSGTVTKKMLPQIVRLYNQMPEPKYVVAMGACACGGGPFSTFFSRDARASSMTSRNTPLNTPAVQQQSCCCAKAYAPA